MPEAETVNGTESEPLMQNWLAGTIVGTMATVALVIFIPGWLVFTDDKINLDVSISIFYWLVCREGNITCRAYGVGQIDAYRYIEDTEAKPENTVLLASVDLILCILCALIVLGDMAGRRPRVTWWNNLKLAVLIFIIFVLNLLITGLFGHSSITLSNNNPDLDVFVPYSLLILTLAALMMLLEFSFLIYLHRISTIPYQTLASASIEETGEDNAPSTSVSRPSINRPC
uniref:Uncharacterized protein LOC111100374 n=1 Tax=Crassostrea virginica TaxID=6565 RepID=A0A8B8A8R9_CRAVI|nr:uncharacterized protein LOC111100374 [Crassostrea virginica]